MSSCCPPEQSGELRTLRMSLGFSLGFLSKGHGPTPRPYEWESARFIGTINLSGEGSHRVRKPESLTALVHGASLKMTRSTRMLRSNAGCTEDQSGIRPTLSGSRSCVLFDPSGSDQTLCASDNLSEHFFSNSQISIRGAIDGTLQLNLLRYRETIPIAASHCGGVEINLSLALQRQCGKGCIAHFANVCGFLGCCSEEGGRASEKE